MRWSVALEAAGDRELTREEIVELADAVAAHDGIAAGIGSTRYGSRLVVEAESRDEAIALATAVFQAAAARADLPPWPVSHVEAISEQLLAIAQQHAKGRLVSALEGGYDLDALAASAAAHVRALMNA